MTFATSALPMKRYPPAGVCIYCGSTTGLGEEHIIPYGLGGRSILPEASCPRCAEVTGKFERTCLRTMFGPLRMYLDLPTRRLKDRPDTLPLKVKINPDDDWSFVDIEREAYPFLFSFPNYDLPDEISGITTTGRRDSATKSLWIRAASSRHTEPIHLEMLCQRLGVASVMPTGKCDTVAFCLMLAKIGHSFTVAELGLNNFEPFLPDMIRLSDTSNRAQYIGVSPKVEHFHISFHEVWFDSRIASRRDIISVRIRLLAPFGAPVYYVATGRK